MHLRIAFVALCAASCAERPVSSSDPSEFSHRELSVPLVLVASEVVSRDPILGRLGETVVSGDRIWVIDYQGTPFFHLFDTLSGNLVRSFGTQGQGPAEFTRIGMISPSGVSESSVWVHDQGKARLTHLTPSTFGLDASDTVATVTVDHPWATRGKIQSFGPDRFLSFKQMAAGDSGFLIFNRAGRLIAAAPREYPGDSSVPANIRRTAMNGAGSCTRPGGEGFAVHYVGAGRIQLYDRDARLKGLADVPYSSDELYKVDPRTRALAHAPDREYYKDCTYTGRLLFALFKGRRITDNVPKDPASGSRFVHVFDLKGALLSVLRLDRPVTSIGVDDAGRNIYAVSTDDAAVYRFRLPLLP